MASLLQGWEGVDAGVYGRQRVVPRDSSELGGGGLAGQIESAAAGEDRLLVDSVLQPCPQ
jgi:hypothetical protein